MLAGGCTHNEEAPKTAAVDINAVAAQAQLDINNYLVARGTPLRAAGRLADPVEGVTRYAALLDHGRYGEAWRMWQGDGRASGTGERMFAQHYAHLSRVRIVTDRATTTARGDVALVPVVFRGVLASGRAVAKTGMFSLRRDPAGVWRIIAATI